MEYIPENSADGELTNQSTYNNHGTKAEQMQCIKESGNGIVATQRQCNSNEFCAVFTEYTYILRPSQQYEDIKEVCKFCIAITPSTASNAQIYFCRLGQSYCPEFS